MGAQPPSFEFFGQLKIAVDGKRITSFPSDKARALLVYLVTEAAASAVSAQSVNDKVHSRDGLTTFFWPGYRDESARASLRQVLHHLRRILGDDKREEKEHYLQITRQTVGFNATLPYTCDVHRFGQLLASCSTHPHEQMATCPVCIAQLREAIALYQGDFLAGFSIDDSTAFEEWRRIKQEQLHVQMLNALKLLTDVALASSDYETARSYAMRQLELEAWSEEAHRQVMRALALSGDRNAALAQYQNCRQILQAEFGIEPDAITTTLYEEIRSGRLEQEIRLRGALNALGAVENTLLPTMQTAADARSQPVIGQPSTALHFANLPTPTQPGEEAHPSSTIHPTPLVGRDQESAQIVNALCDSQNRLITLVGAGGMGKTRLALHVAERIRQLQPSIFVDGLYFVELTPVMRLADVATAIAAALRLSNQREDPQQAILNFVKDKKLLLILDNFEHLLPATSLLTELLAKAPDLCILVTSRIALTLYGEQMIQVQGIDYLLDKNYRLAEEVPAVRLFTQSARRANPHFAITEQNRTALLQLCRYLEGMPLALELAAVWTQWLTVAEISREIVRNADFLATNYGDMPARQRSMRAVFEWSWQLLSASEQRVLRQLSVFRGGFTRQAAEQVADAALDTLVSLVNKSMLRMSRVQVELSTNAPDDVLQGLAQEGVTTEGQSTNRYEFHELLRQFAASHLTSEEEAQAVHRHANYYLTFAIARESRLALSEPRQATDELLAEIDNFRAAWATAVNALDLPLMDATIHTLWLFYQLAGMVGEQERVFAQAIERIQQLPSDPAYAGEKSDHLRLLGKMLAYYGRVLQSRSRYDTALTVAQQAIEVSRAQGEVIGEALAHVVCGQTLSRKSQLQLAHEHLELALEQTKTHWQRLSHDEALQDTARVAYSWLATNALAMNEPVKARAYLVEGEFVCRNPGNVRGEMTYLYNCAHTDFHLGDLLLAQREYEQALKLARRLKYPWGEGISLQQLGIIAHLLGDWTQAIAWLQQAQRVLNQIGDVLEEVHTLATLAILYSHLGDFTTARQWLERSQQQSQMTDAPAAERATLLAHSLLLWYEEQRSSALTTAQLAYRLGEQAGHPQDQTHALLLIAHIQREMQQFEAAASSYQRALELCERLTVYKERWLAEAQAGLAAVEQARNNQAAAQEWLEPLLKSLAHSPRLGLHEPFRLYGIVAHLLHMLGDARADTLLEQGIQLLQQDACQIQDDRLRQSFLEKVASHRYLQQAIEQSQQRPRPPRSIPNGVLLPMHRGESRTPVKHNLPVQTIPFIGRSRELAELSQRLSQAECRLLTLAGPGGMGKTRLALEVAQQIVTTAQNSDAPFTSLKRHFADGIFFVPLAPLQSSETLVPTIATALGLELRSANPQQELVDFLQPKQMMLILDNFEHLLAGANVIVQLLQSAPALQLIVTSRTRLNLQGEVVYQVPPLALTTSTQLAEASACDAVQLFVQHAKRSVTGLTLQPDNLQAVLRICQLVEGMPLGLELAAAWSEWLSLDEIAKEIEKSSDFLASDALDVPTRQRSMRAVFEWSWKLLDERERQLFCQLAIFRGGFTREAAEQITGATLRTLISLANKSLLNAPHQPGIAVRYHVHELLRQFAAEQLNAQTDKGLVIANRHSNYYLDFIAARELRMARNDPVAAVAELRAEIDNVRQAWLHAVDQANIELLGKSVSGLARFYELTGMFNETLQMMGYALERMDKAAAKINSGTDEDQTAQQFLSKALALQALVLVKLGKYDEGMATAQRAIHIGSTSGSMDGEMYGQFVVAQIWYRKGDYITARACFEGVRQQIVSNLASVEMTELLNDVWYAVHVWLGNIEGGMSNFAVARSYFDESIRICQMLKKVRAELHARINLASMFMLSRNYTDARRIYEECLALARNLEYAWGEAQVQLELGEVMRMLGEYSYARQLLLQAEVQQARIQAKVEHVYNYAILARLHCYLGDFERARAWLHQIFTDPLFQSSGILQFFGFSLRCLLAYLTGEAEMALQAAQEVVQIGQRLNKSNCQAEGWLLLGHAACALELREQAEQSYREAQQLFTQIGNHAALAEVCAGLALLAQQQGNLAEAQRLIEEFLPLLDEKSQLGLDEPFFTYLAAYQILVAVRNPRASSILSNAHARLQTYLEHIDSQELRQSFLGNVPTHRNLVATYTALQQQRETATPGTMASDMTTQLVNEPNSLAAQHHLPTMLPPLVGRERDLSEITACLQRPRVRLLTLVGPGGMGKTRLALAAAQQLTTHFEDGVYLVELANVDDPTLLPQAVAAALGQNWSTEAGGEDIVATYLGNKKVLLVLDNCEHLRETVAFWVKRWLKACPTLCILATSQGALAIGGETVWSVPTLAYPVQSVGLAPEQLLSFAAIQLFVTRAQEVKPGFALTASNGAAIAQICQRLEGIPLALELAAARVKLLTPTEIATRLNQCINVAIGGNQRAPARHQTMQAALDWSFDSLSGEEQSLFQQLALFVGGFSLQAVETLTNAPDALSPLARLMDRSLVTAETVGEQTRYRMLGIIRQYAYDKLLASGNAPALRQRHAAYFLQLAESAQLDVEADGESLWLQPDADNLNSALDWALSSGATRTALRLAGALHWYWWMRGRLRAQQPALQHALTQLNLDNDCTAAGPASGCENERAVLAFAAGTLHALWQETDQARLLLTQALTLAQAAQHQHLVGLALRQLASVAIQQKEYSAADTFIAHGLAVWQMLGGNWHIAWLYSHQGDLAYQRGDRTAAWLAFEASTKLPVNPGARGYPFRRMGYLAMERGDRTQALVLCRESLQLNMASGDHQGIAASLVGIASFTISETEALPKTSRNLLLQRAAQLLGAVEPLLKTVEDRLLPIDHVTYLQTTHLLQEELAIVSPTAFQTALSLGRSLTVAQVTDLALHEDDPVSPGEAPSPYASSEA
ncbi:MAG: tetratricopeptide repeat protein [Caldilineaceae bacterium]